MKLLKITVFLLLFPAFLCFLFPLNASAQDDTVCPVSPALSVITDSLQMRKSGLKNTSLYLTANDFEEFLYVDQLKSVTVCALPSEFKGALMLGDVPVRANQKITRADLNKLRFVPASDEITDTVFSFYSSDSCCESPINCNLYFFNEINTAPVIASDAINTEKLMTIENIMVYSTVNAYDNEGDGLLFEVVSMPKHGIVSFSDEGNGGFTYTPAIGYTGKDKFEYVVSDIYGNRSDSAMIEITVEKNTDGAFFKDMLKREEHLYAVKASSYGIMSGALSGGSVNFSPDASPTRAEFLRMALKASGIENELQAVDTGFTDDSDIPPHLKGYVSYAVNSGYVSGTKTENGVFFYPNATITRAEAAVIINNIINAEGSDKSIVFADSEDIPSWAEDDVAALAELKIMEGLNDGCYSPNSDVTNAQAAKIFCRIYELNKK